jgi:hypothetical protein
MKPADKQARKNIPQKKVIAKAPAAPKKNSRDC